MGDHPNPLSIISRPKNALFCSFLLKIPSCSSQKSTFFADDQRSTWTWAKSSLFSPPGCVEVVGLEAWRSSKNFEIFEKRRKNIFTHKHFLLFRLDVLDAGTFALARPENDVLIWIKFHRKSTFEWPSFVPNVASGSWKLFSKII